MNGNTFKTIVLLSSFAAGVLFRNWLDPYSGAVAGVIPLMLLFSFSKADLRQVRIRRLHPVLIAASVLMAFTAYGVLRPFGTDLALAAFMVAITPTATGSMVVIALLGGEIEFPLVAAALSNVVIALAGPFLISLVAPQTAALAGLSAAWPVLRKTILIVIVPLIVSQVLRRAAPKASGLFARHHAVAFYIWALAVVLVSAHSTVFLLAHPEVPRTLVLRIAAVSLVICAANFSLGRWLGGKRYGLEAGQSLGQKNTLLTIWLSMAMLSPVIALGPAFYVLWHNLFNSWQLWRHPGAIPALAPAPR